MNRILGSIAIGTVALVMNGCAWGPWGTGPGGTMPAFIYTDKAVYPASNTSSTVHNLTTDDFEIGGTVVAEGSMENILGVIARGDNGYQNLLTQARAAGADDVINVRIDVRHSNVLTFYVKTDIILTGQAVTYKR
jgi:uncharacterized protein YbjQ (UPF0145 family)